MENEMKIVYVNKKGKMSFDESPPLCVPYVRVYYMKSYRLVSI